MTSLITLPPAPPPPAAAGPPRPGGRSAPPGGDPFASVLDQQARTATAEGLAKQQDANGASAANGPGGRNAAAPDGPPQPADSVQPGAEGTDPAALAAALISPLGGATPPTATAGAPTGVVVDPATGGTPVAQPATATAAPQAAPVAAPPAGSGQPAPAAETAQPVLTTASPTATAAPTASAPATAATTPETSEPAQPPQAATATGATARPAAADGAAANGGQSSGFGRRTAGQPAQTTPTAPLPGDAAAEPAPAASGAAGAPASAAASGQPAASANGQSGAPTAFAPAAAHHAAAAHEARATSAAETRGTAVTLDRAIETVRLALRAGAERGVTHARISLSPQELGGIEIHLRHTADGIVAKVIADSTGAAQLLQQSGGDLRRQLEQQGLNLLRLDIGASGEQAGQAGGQRGLGDAGSGFNGGARAAASDDALLTVERDVAASDRRLELPNGALVDVLA